MKKLILVLLLILAVFLLPITFLRAYAPTIALKPPIKLYAVEKVLDTFGGTQWGYFDDIVSKESYNWTIYTAHYPTGYAKVKQKDGTYKLVKSSAYGLCGFLDQTWKDMGYEKTDDPYIQVDACIKYIKVRYGSPKIAKAYHDKNNSF